MKRLLDVVISAVVIAVTSPILAAAAVAVRSTMGAPIVYRARRVGKDGRTFDMYKLRTMRAATGPTITSSHDPRITPLGGLLRRTRIDELPQMWNVLRGDMSLVGPRPEDPRFVALYSPAERAVLSVAPGVTGAAQLVFDREADVLPRDEPETVYVRDILPLKLRIDLEYVRTRTLAGDLLILARTLLSWARRGHGRTTASSWE